MARSVCPEPISPAACPPYAEPDEVSDSPVPTLPRDLLTCPVDPILQFMAGKADPDIQQNAFLSLAIMAATGTAWALRTADEHPHAQHVGDNIDELTQSDDDQSAISKQRRPPWLFTLGWRF